MPPRGIRDRKQRRGVIHSQRHTNTHLQKESVIVTKRRKSFVKKNDKVLLRKVGSGRAKDETSLRTNDRPSSVMSCDRRGAPAGEWAPAGAIHFSW